MRIVSNAGPLIALGKLSQLGLLLKLSDEILIPHLIIQDIKAQPALWISERLCDQILAQAQREAQHRH